MLTLLVGVSCRRGTDPQAIRLSGNVEAEPIEISFRVAGKVLERPVEEGQTVAKDQLLARLESRDLEQQLGARRAEAASAKAALALLLAGSRQEDVEAAKALLAQVQADLTRQEADLPRVEGLFQQSILSRRDYDAALAAFNAAKARVREATQRSEVVRKGPRPEELAQGRARAAQAEQALGLAETQLGYATLRAPIAGVVLSKNVEPHEFVAPGTPVLTLADLGHVFVRAYVEETDLGRVKLGQKARIKTDTWPDRTFEGRVAFLASEAEFTPKTVQTRKERTRLVYRVKIEVPNPNHDLKPGMPADVEILP